MLPRGKPRQPHAAGPCTPYLTAWHATLQTLPASARQCPPVPASAAMAVIAPPHKLCWLAAVCKPGPRPVGALLGPTPSHLPPHPLQRLGLDKELPKLSVIHVAGTKGKGSTCAMVERMLREAGYKTGLFTSPHLIDVRERIRINGWVPAARLPGGACGGAG